MRLLKGLSWQIFTRALLSAQKALSPFGEKYEIHQQKTVLSLSKGLQLGQILLLRFSAQFPDLTLTCHSGHRWKGAAYHTQLFDEFIMIILSDSKKSLRPIWFSFRQSIYGTSGIDWCKKNTPRPLAPTQYLGLKFQPIWGPYLITWLLICVL